MCVCYGSTGTADANSGVLTLSEKTVPPSFSDGYGAPSFQKPGFWRQTSGKEVRTHAEPNPAQNRVSPACLLISGARPPAHGGDKTGCRRTSRVGGRRPREKPGFRPVGATRCKTGFRNLLSRRVTGRATKAETRFLASVKTPQLLVRKKPKVFLKSTRKF